MDKCLTLSSLVEGLKTHGEAAAVFAVRDDTVDRWSYASLADTIERMAAGLLRRGVSRAEPVAILAPNGPEWIAAYFAIVRAGALAVPIDHLIGKTELARVISDCECRRIVTTEVHLPDLRSLGQNMSLDVILLSGNGEATAEAQSWLNLLSHRPDALPKIHPDDPASLLYTSGTTGTPKGIVLSHGNLLANLEALLAAGLVRAGDRVLIPLPFHHAYPFTVGLLATLASGAAVVLPAGLSGPQLIHALKKTETTTMIGVPRLYVAMLAGIEAKLAARGRLAIAAYHRLLSLSVWLRRRFWIRIGRIVFQRLHKEFGPRLRLLGSGGARLEPETAWRLEGLGWEVISGYGLTETAPILTLNPRRRERIGSAGLPVRGVELRIDAPAGSEFGEVLARGPNVFAGYWNNPEATRSAFTGDNWFRTGDLGFLDGDGYLHIVGRAKELIVLSDGKNIFPDQIEDVIARNPFISEIAVLERAGVLVGLVVPDSDAVRARGEARVEALLREQVEQATAALPPYQRLSGLAVSREALPRTPLGKLKRHLLGDIYEGAKVGIRHELSAVLSDEDQALLKLPRAKQVWDWLVTLYPDRTLQPDDSPQLDLGIDSLQWVSLTLEMQERFGVSITEESIAGVATLRDLLEVVISAETAVPTAALSAEQERWLEPPGPVLLMLGRVIHILLRVIMRRWFRLTVSNIDRLPDAGPFIMAPNHTSYLDSLALAAVLSWPQLKSTYWAGWTGVLFRGPIGRLFSRIGRIFPVDPDRSPGASLEYGAATLARQNILVWFPEGRRSPTGQLRPFLPGVGVLAGTTKAPVVPVLIEGGFQALPTGRRLPRRHKMSITFGSPSRPAELEAAGSG